MCGLSRSYATLAAMNAPEPGWYDDPWSPEQYRYWDGSMWTPHAAPKRLPPATPAAASTSSVGSAQGPATPPPYTGYAQGPQTWRPTFGPTTPDGVPLSGWWRRVGAKLLDQLIIYVISLPFAGYFWFQAAGEFSDYFDRAMDASRAGQSSAVTLPSDLQVHILVGSLITLLFGVVYEVLLLRRSGATWGKMAAGIRVRPREVEAQLSWVTIGRRVGFTQGLAVLSLVPLLGIAAGIVSLLDVLWPLWDSKKQALHDKVAATNVVRTR